MTTSRTPHIKHFRKGVDHRTRRSKHFKNWLNVVATEIGATFNQAYAALAKVHDARLLGELAVSAKEPANTVAPAVTGTATIGNTLTCSTGTWTGTPTPTYTYQWYSGGLEVVGATANTYVVRAADSLHTVLCQVTATNSLGSVSHNSNSVPVG
jgi:hypothetical protein